MTYRVLKTNLNDINTYLNSLNKSLTKNSLLKSKINRIDHYNWWFSNKKLQKYYLLKEKKKIIFFWYKKIFVNKTNYFFSGWWPNYNNLEFKDFFFITKTLLKYSKNCLHVAIILKKNNFSIKLHKYFKFKKINKSARLYKEIMSIYNKTKTKEKKKTVNYVIMIKKN